MSSKITIPGNKGIWHGYDSYRFEIEGIECIVVCADSPLKGNPWIWRARFFNADPALDLAMLRHGVHLVHTDVTDLAGGPEAMRRMDRFYNYLVKELNFSPAPVLESYSRGALPALNWGIRNPEKLSMMILDSPLCNLKSWPKSPFERELCRKAGVLAEDFSIIPEWNPIDNIEPLIRHKVPVTVIYEEKDNVIPIKENAERLLELFRSGNGNVRAYAGKYEFTSDDVEQLALSAVQALK